MGIYYSSHLIFGLEGCLKEEVKVEDIGDLHERVGDFAKGRNFIAVTFDPTYKQGENEQEELSIFVGYEIGVTNDIKNTFASDSIQGKIAQAMELVDKQLILDLEDNFPEFDWFQIELKNIISVG